MNDLYDHEDGRVDELPLVGDFNPRWLDRLVAVGAILLIGLIALAAAVAVVGCAGPSVPTPAPPSQQATEPPAPSASPDPKFDTCADVVEAGLGPYVEGTDPEYDWYRDGDGDGIACDRS